MKKLAPFFLFLLPEMVYASGSPEKFSQTTILFVLILFVAKICGYASKKIGVPELVGELIAGVTLGNLALFGVDFDIATTILSNEFLVYAAELGVILLLFQVGLESNFKELRKVGKNSFVVAVLGVLFPVLMGYYFAISTHLAHEIGAWFVGATLAATSVGITAKILGDAGLIKSPSSQVILGAAVIDDVIGILLLVVLAAIATTGTVEPVEIAMILIKSAGFFVVSIFIGQYLLAPLLKLYDKNTVSGAWTAFGIVFALVFAQASAWAGLAPIIGAFVAGLILEEKHFQSCKHTSFHKFEGLLKPIADMLLPIFFVSIGAQVKLAVLNSWVSFGLIALLLMIAIAGKAIAGFGVTGKGFDKAGIGVGMIPRGEVGLIFASYGLKYQIMSAASYSILVFVVLFTTVLGPILLKPRLKYFGNPT